MESSADSAWYWLSSCREPDTLAQIRLGCERFAPLRGTEPLDDRAMLFDDDSLPVGGFLCFHDDPRGTIDIARRLRRRNVPVLLTAHGPPSPALQREAFRLRAPVLRTPLERSDIDTFVARAWSARRVAEDRVADAIAAFARRCDLAPREHEILAAMAAGARRADLPSRMHISHSTLKWHVNRLLRKCGARNLESAACLALRECHGSAGAPPAFASE